MVMVGDVWWFGEEFVGSGRGTLPHTTKGSQTARSKLGRGMTQYLGLRSTGMGLVHRSGIMTQYLGRRSTGVGMLHLSQENNHPINAFEPLFLFTIEQSTLNF